MVDFKSKKKKNMVMLPEELLVSGFCGELCEKYKDVKNLIVGKRVSKEEVTFSYNNEVFSVKCYNLIQNIFAQHRYFRINCYA